MQFQDTYSARDLENFGVILLTGEACSLAMRILCDLTEEGVKLIRDFLRVEPTAEPWNSRGVKSIMLPHSILPELWVFAHVRKGTKYVFQGGYVDSAQWTTSRYDSYDDNGNKINNVIKHPIETWKEEFWAIDDDDLMKRLRDQIGHIFYINRFYTKSTDPGNGLDNQHTMSERIR